MMSMAELQLLAYADAILRQRGYQDAADHLAGVLGSESERLNHDSAPRRAHLRAVS